MSICKNDIIRKILVPLCFALVVFPVFAQAEFLPLNTAIQNAKTACSGIDDSMAHLKMMAGINTAVTAVGTVGGGVALGTGIAKTNVDKKLSGLKDKVKKLIAEKSTIFVEPLTIENEQEFRAAIHTAALSNNPIVKQVNELEQKSKTLGNVRTGTLAASTVTNIAGTAIAATNKVDGDLEEKINKCVASIKDLSNAKLTAKVENTATDIELANADIIITACRDYEYIDIKQINNRATGAAVASGIGAGTGFVGTVTSAVANTEQTRAGDEKREKNLNTTANVMSGATTVASATATIFNATQISAIKKVAIVAETCEGALK